MYHPTVASRIIGKSTHLMSLWREAIEMYKSERPTTGNGELGRLAYKYVFYHHVLRMPYFREQYFDDLMESQSDRKTPFPRRTPASEDLAVLIKKHSWAGVVDALSAYFETKEYEAMMSENFREKQLFDGIKEKVRKIPKKF